MLPWGGGEDDRAFANYITAAEWIRDNLSDDTYVISRKPRQTYLFSGRKGYRYLYGHTKSTNAWENITLHADTRPVVLIEDGFTINSGYGQDRIYHLEPVLTKHRHEMTLLFETPPPVTKVWKIPDGQ